MYRSLGKKISNCSIYREITQVKQTQLVYLDENIRILHVKQTLLQESHLNIFKYIS